MNYSKISIRKGKYPGTPITMWLICWPDKRLYQGACRCKWCGSWERAVEFISEILEGEK
jgi:hypothetical protein